MFSCKAQGFTPWENRIVGPAVPGKHKTLPISTISQAQRFGTRGVFVLENLFFVRHSRTYKINLLKSSSCVSSSKRCRTYAALISTFDVPMSAASKLSSSSIRSRIV